MVVVCNVSGNRFVLSVAAKCCVRARKLDLRWRGDPESMSCFENSAWYPGEQTVKTV
jgi:hypothetical protein